MRRLFYKEIMESRFLPLALSVLFAFSLVLWGAEVAVGGVVALGCLIVGLAAGCSMISSEFGRGTIRLLYSLPLSKGQIWFCKLASVATITAITGTLIIVYTLASGSGLIGHIDSINSELIHSPIGADVQFPQWWIVPLSMGFFGLGCSVFASSIVDRPMTAIILSGVIAAALATVFMSIASACEPILGSSSYFGMLVYAILDLVAVILLLASYCAFCFDKQVGLMRPPVIAAAVSLTLLMALGLVIVLCGALLPRQTAQDIKSTDISEYDDSAGTHVANVEIDAPVTCSDNDCTGADVKVNIAPYFPVSYAHDVTSSDPLMKVSLHFPVNYYSVAPLVVVDYVPHGPRGKEVTHLTIRDRSGKETALILVTVNKVALPSHRTTGK